MYLAQVHPCLGRPRLIEIPKLPLHVEMLVDDQIAKGFAACHAMPGENAPFELPVGRATPCEKRGCPDNAERVPSKAARTTPLDYGNLPEGAVDICLSFVLTPLLMGALCAVARELQDACWRPTAWQKTLVDPVGHRPSGRQAHTHHTLWSLSAAVVCRPWAFRSVCFHMFSNFKAWCWSRTQGKSAKWYKIREGAHLLISKQSVPTSNVNVLVDCFGGAGGSDGVVHFGVSDTDNPIELASLVVHKQTAHWRGPPPEEQVSLNAYYCNLGASQGTMFSWNLETCAGSMHVPTTVWASGRPITFGLRNGDFVTESQSTREFCSRAKCPNWNALDPSKSQYYAFALVQREGDSPTAGTIDITPLLSKKEL